jgi:hypothetical protein
MNEFISAISMAATSPYALVAYAIAAILFLWGGARLRTVQTVLKAIASVPPSDRKHVIESITNSVIPDTISAEEWIRHNKSRSIFLLIGTAMVLTASLGAIAIINPSPGPGEPPPSEATREVASSWLKKMDAGEYNAAFEETFIGFRKAHSLEWWLKASHTYREPLGNVESRMEANSSSSEFRQGKPLNGYTIIYLTKFQNLKAPIREMISFASPGEPEPWRVAAYILDIPPSEPFLAKKENK